MKRATVRISLVIVLLSFISPVHGIAQDVPRAAFTAPENGETIVNRKEFPVSLEIAEFSPGGKYWVAIASVKTHGGTWEEVVELYEELKTGYDESMRDELVRLIAEWDIDLYWPKFYVPENPYRSNVFDGGSNPLRGLEPQPMILLALNADDTLHRHFRRWLREGAAGQGYPGIPASSLGRDMILARCEIFFP